MMMDDRIALVTGASSGIGRAIAAALLAAGARVVLAGRNVVALEQTAAGHRSCAHVMRLDVTDYATVDALAENVPAEFRALDLLVNNAGHDVGGRTRFDQGRTEDWTSIIETNVSGLMRVTRAVLPGMIARGRGDIVNIGSINALRVIPEMVAYGASKAAVHAFTDGLRGDLANTPIRVIEILPGLTETDIVLRRFRGDQARTKAYFESFGVALKPEDIAAGVLYAVSQPAHVTVAHLTILPTNRY
ncbi:MAG TPA: SDR family oxidoreductase [Stellaceae bacterium]|nr:SDR family oxidoreductase [Stellaceae bacterium]